MILCKIPFVWLAFLFLLNEVQVTSGAGMRDARVVVLQLAASRQVAAISESGVHCEVRGAGKKVGLFLVR
jgi:hypothetical protein